MNIEIAPINVNVNTYYLYDGVDKGMVKGKIIGVSAYEGFPLTFHVLIDDSYLYSDLPITTFTHKNIQSKISDISLKGKFCPKNEIENFTLKYLSNKKVSCYLPFDNIWISGEYITSFDFYTDNLSFHLIKMDNGQFGLIPNHKINWNNKKVLTDYKKSHIDHRI